ncbi:MAG TPA: glycoside hydrolase family 15 protein [Actinocrinis sp.]|nr:glycoside hydrolase family 15 protein [Actinocrinis sp.]
MVAALLRGPLTSFVAVLSLTAGLVVAGSAPALAATASGGPGSTPYWNEDGGVQGFATALGSASKVWYTLADGALQNVYYPQTDQPDTYGLQFYVTDGSSFADSETGNASHAVSLADPTSLTWTQTNTASSGKWSISKTYVADPARSVVLISTTFTNNSSTALHLYADYQPYLANQGFANSGGTDASGDLVAVNGSVASAMAASTGFSAASTGYLGTTSSGVSQLTSGYALSTQYSGVSSSGHIDQAAQIPVNASGSTTFTLALAFDGTESAAVGDASASLGGGFTAAESSYESGWHSWISGLSAAPASVSSNAALLRQYYISLMEIKADEDKTYAGAFVAAPSNPWGGSVSAASAGAHGYHLVWTRDEYEMATALMSAGDSADAKDALSYLFNYEVTSSGWVKQNSWLNGTAVWSGTQLDQVSFPIILAYQLGLTDSATWAKVKSEAGYLVSNGPVTGEERWEEIGGYSPSTIAAEIAGLVCASSIASANGDSADAATYLSTAKSWAASVDGWTYTTSGPFGNGDYFLRITQDGNPNSGASIGLANGGGNWDDRQVVDAGFLELVRLGVKSASAADITNSLTAIDSVIKTTTAYGPVWKRYDHDGYGETTAGADYTGSGVGNPWPVLTGERGEYDLALGDSSDAQSMLQTMQSSANAGGQISEQVWGSATAATAPGTGWTLGQGDNSSTPLMWAMAQYVRLAQDISHGGDLDTPSLVCSTFGTCPGSQPPPSGYTETVNVTVPVNTAASGLGVYLDGNFSVLGNGGSDWAANGVAMTKLDDTHYTATISATSAANLAYKFVLGANWSYVEKSASCADIGNRSLTVNNGTTTNTVLNWGGPNACGSAEAVIDVTVPAATPSTSVVYIAGNFSALGTGMSASNDWNAGLYPLTKVGSNQWQIIVPAVSGSTLQFKFDLGGSWTNAEEEASCGSVANRSFYFNGSGSSYTANDTVLNWAGLNGC